MASRARPLRKVNYDMASRARRCEKRIMTWQAGQVARLSWDARWNTEIVEMLVKACDSLEFLAFGRSVPAGRPAKRKSMSLSQLGPALRKEVCHGQPSPATAKRKV